MKLFSMTAVLAFSLTLAVGMGSKSKPAIPTEEPKVLPESTRVSAPINTPVELIENTVEDNQKIEKDLGKPIPQPENTLSSKKTIKPKAPVVKKNKTAPTKKPTSKPNSKPKPKKTPKK